MMKAKRKTMIRGMDVLGKHRVLTVMTCIVLATTVTASGCMKNSAEMQKSEEWDSAVASEVSKEALPVLDWNSDETRKKIILPQTKSFR